MRAGARLAALAVGVAGVLVVLFALPARLPGGRTAAFLGARGNDPAAARALRAQLHTGRVLPVQFLDFVGDAVDGDLGHSPVSDVDVGALVGERAAETACFAFGAIALAGLLGRWRRRARRGDASAVPAAVVGLPVLGALAIAARFGGIPTTDPHAAVVARAGASLGPALALGVALALWSTARRRSARDLIVAVTLGTLVTESVFGLPGLGSTLSTSVAALDPMTTRAVFLVVAIAVVVALVVVAPARADAPAASDPPSVGGRATRGVAATIWIAALVVLVAARLHLRLPAPGRLAGGGPQGVSGTHPFGTDAVGRDVLARVLSTAGGSLLLVVAAIVVAVVAGVVIGVAIGFAGGRLERAGVALLSGWATFPGELVALVLLAFNGRSGSRSAVALAFVAAPAFARGAQQRTLDSIRASDPALSTGAWLRSFGSRISFGVARATFATVFVGAGQVLATEVVAGLLGFGPTAARTWSREISIQLPFAAHAPQAVAAPLLVALVTAAALATLGKSLRPAERGRQRFPQPRVSGASSAPSAAG